MKLGKEDLVLYSLHLVNQDKEPGRDYTKDSLSNALGITANTLDLYLTRLKTQGMIFRFKKKYQKDVRKTIEITDMGQEYIKSLEKTINCLLLTEQRHNIPACIEVTKVMSQLPDPLEKAFLLSLYCQSKYFDLPMFMNSFKIKREDSNIINIFSNIEINPYGTARESFVESLFNASLFGNLDPLQLTQEEWPKEDINALITLSQAKIRMGKLEDAKMLIFHLLSRSDLSLNQWFITKVNNIIWHSKSGDLVNANKLAEELIASVDNKVMQSYAKMQQADALFFLGRKDDSLDTYKSVISSFTTHGLPLFLAMSHNNRGVLYYIMEDYISAEKDWLKARKYAREAGSEFIEAKALPNLASIAMKIGKYDLARSYLQKANDIMSKFNDFEGIAVLEVNFALLAIETGDLESVREHFKRCREVAFPLPPAFMIEIFKGELRKRAKEKGIADIDAYL